MSLIKSPSWAVIFLCNAVVADSSSSYQGRNQTHHSLFFCSLKAVKVCTHQRQIFCVMKFRTKSMARCVCLRIWGRKFSRHDRIAANCRTRRRFLRQLCLCASSKYSTSAKYSPHDSQSAFRVYIDVAGCIIAEQNGGPLTRDRWTGAPQPSYKSEHQS